MTESYRSCVLRILLSTLVLGVAIVGAAPEGDLSEPVATTGRVVKVLPHLLDLEGQHNVSPSLFDRDAYQAHLRDNPEECSGIRYDILWKARDAEAKPLIVRLELKGLFEGREPREKVIEVTVEGERSIRRWSGLELSGEEYQEFGKITAWRATLWSDGKLLGKQQSFLW